MMKRLSGARKPSRQLEKPKAETPKTEKVQKEAPPDASSAKAES